MPHADLRIEDAVNETCPWSGKPIVENSLTRYRGAVVGFCNPGCRDKFEKAVEHFERALTARPVAPGTSAKEAPTRSLPLDGGGLG